MIKVKNEVPIYEVDGKEIKGIDSPKLVVESHWSCNKRVKLKLDGKEITVIGDDLVAAIVNAQNTRRW